MTKLVYAFDPLNTTNFHRYIDGLHNLVILIKLCNGIVLGGYSSAAIEKGKSEKHKKGFLFSLSPEPVQYLMKEGSNQSSVTYDDLWEL